MTAPALLAALLAAFALICVATVRVVRRHSATGGAHRLHRPGLRDSRLRHLIAPRRYR